FPLPHDAAAYAGHPLSLHDALPIFGINSSGKSSFVCVKKARHLLEFSCPACTKAPVGHASRQIRQSPQLSSTGESGTKGKFVIISPKYTQEPYSCVINKVFFPGKPTPARSAAAASFNQPISTIFL